MQRRSLILVSLLLALAVPMSASQFIELPFDQVARESAFVVRGNVISTWSAWDASHETIFTYATVRVSRYFGDTTGPDTLMVREVGGTVDGYTQEAVGFPAIRRGEQVVLMLAKWEDGSEYRMHAFNQSKYLVRNRNGVEVLVADPITQGAGRPGADQRLSAEAYSEADGAALTVDEFAQMVDAAREGRITAGIRQQHE
jgi:hypothetical protein